MKDFNPDLIGGIVHCDICGVSSITDIISDLSPNQHTIPLRKMRLNAEGLWICERCEE